MFKKKKKRSRCLRSSHRGAKVQTEFTGPAKDTGARGGAGEETGTMEKQQRMQSRHEGFPSPSVFL